MVATSPIDFRLRLATSHDLPALKDLFRRSSLSNEGDRQNLLAHPDALEFSGRPVEEGRVRVAVIDDRIVGFASVLVTGRIGELDDLFVDPNWMRHGIATALVLDALARAREQQVTPIEVTPRTDMCSPSIRASASSQMERPRPSTEPDTECTSTSPGHPARP